MNMRSFKEKVLFKEYDVNKHYSSAHDEYIYPYNPECLKSFATNVMIDNNEKGETYLTGTLCIKTKQEGSVPGFFISERVTGFEELHYDSVRVKTNRRFDYIIKRSTYYFAGEECNPPITFNVDKIYKTDNMNFYDGFEILHYEIPLNHYAGYKKMKSILITLKKEFYTNPDIVEHALHFISYEGMVKRQNRRSVMYKELLDKISKMWDEE